MTLENEKKRWEEQVVNPVVNKFKERKSEFLSPSGIPLPQGGSPGRFGLHGRPGIPG